VRYILVAFEDALGCTLEDMMERALYTYLNTYYNLKGYTARNKDVQRVNEAEGET
jgi:hypothetical protein